MFSASTSEVELAPVASMMPMMVMSVFVSMSPPVSTTCLDLLRDTPLSFPTPFGGGPTGLFSFKSRQDRPGNA